MQIWRHAIILTSEAILEGLAKVRGRCTLVGRAQMSADLQEAVHALRAVTPVSRETTAALEALLFLNDGYIKVAPGCSLCCGPSRCTLGHQMLAQSSSLLVAGCPSQQERMARLHEAH